MSIKISTIIRTYNRAYILGEALQSALNQSTPPAEIIVVDDGSTDTTSDVVSQFKDSRIRLITHRHNRGVGASGNTGILASNGDFIAFLDSDDLWKVNKLEEQIAFLSRHNDVDILFSDVEIEDTGTVIPSTMQFMKVFPRLLGKNASEAGDYLFAGRQMYLCLLEEVPIKTNTLMIRRSLLSAVGMFNETCRSGEDWELLLRLARSAHFGYIDRALAIQRRMPDATHRKHWEHDKSFLLRSFLSEKKTLQGDVDALCAVNRGILGHCNNLAFIYLYSHRRWKSMKTYMRGFLETGSFRMLACAAAVLLPLSVRDHLKKVVRRYRSLVLGRTSKSSETIRAEAVVR